MKKTFLIGLAIIAFLCMPGCSNKKPSPEPSPEPGPQPAWVGHPAAIEFHCRADKKLNEFNGRSHTLLLVVYQLKEPDFFTKLAKDPDGLKRLLRFETVSDRLAGEQGDVAACRRFIINPGEEKTLTLDRIEGVKGVGLVAGYYNLVPGRVSRYLEIPVRRKRGILRFWKVKALVGFLSADLNFGPHELTIKTDPEGENE